MSSSTNKCVEKYIEEIEMIRRRYNNQLDNMIIELERLKKNNGSQREIKDVYRNIRQVIKNETLDEKLVDTKIKNCVCKDFVGGKKKR